MPTSFSSSDARALTDQYRRMTGDLDAALSRAQAYPTQVAETAQKLATRKAYNMLRKVPIDELRGRIPRLRVKTLVEYGYRTLADVYAAHVHNLAAVNGISESSAYAMKRAAAELAAEMRDGAKISLSADDVNPDSTALVVAISRYLRSGMAVQRAHAAGDPRARMLAGRAASTVELCNGLSRLFAFGEKRRADEAAFEALRSMVNGDYGSELLGAARELQDLDGVAPEAAWAEFRANPIRFTNTLEAFAPDLVGTDDAAFGLPEELAREVQEECFFPDGLLCELRRYQEWGVKYILHQGRVLLGDEMGLGKTIQAIATMVSLRNTGATHFLVVCPASVLSNWAHEVRRHSLLSVTKLYGAGRKAAVASWSCSGGVAVTTYETLGRIDILETTPLSLVVVDEAHYVKNAEAKRSVSVRELCARCKRVLFMTGTPIENNVGEMESLISVLRPQIAARLCGMDTLPSAPRFREAVAPVYYRRKREDVLTELPELIESLEWCTMGAEEARVYERDALGRSYMATRRVSWNVGRAEDSSKATRLKELVDEAVGEGRKVLVFSFFLDTIRFVMEALGDRALPPITGSMPPEKRQDVIDEFDKAPAGSVLVSQIQAGGTGLNIQSASVVVICEPQLKPSIENQAISRAYRMGQARNVLVYRLLCEDSIDERITELLDKKQRIFDVFADKSEAAVQSVEIDKRTFGDLIEEEIKRINGKNGANSPEGAGRATDGGEAADNAPRSDAAGESSSRGKHFAASAAR